MRYAKALMGYAKSAGAGDALYRDFSMLERSFKEHRDLCPALENPVLTMP